MSSYYVYSGQTSSGVTLYNDYMGVLSGGRAIGTTIRAYGRQYVYSGGGMYIFLST